MHISAYNYVVCMYTISSFPNDMQQKDKNCACWYVLTVLKIQFMYYYYEQSAISGY